MKMNEHKPNHTIIPSALIHDEHLSLKDIGLLCTMLALPDDFDFSIIGLADMMPNDGRDAISSSLGRIKKAGYLRITQKRENGAFKGYIWEVSDMPEFLEKAD